MPNYTLTHSKKYTCIRIFYNISEGLGGSEIGKPPESISNLIEKGETLNAEIDELDSSLAEITAEIQAEGENEDLRSQAKILQKEILEKLDALALINQEIAARHTRLIENIEADGLPPNLDNGERKAILGETANNLNNLNIEIGNKDTLLSEAELLLNFPDAKTTLSQYPGILHTINQVATRNHLDPKLICSIIQAESTWNANASNKGARGVLQLTPITLKQIQQDTGVKVNPRDPLQSIEYGIAYFAKILQKSGGNIDAALAGYNAGPYSRTFQRAVANPENIQNTYATNIGNIYTKVTSGNILASAYRRDDSKQATG